MPPRDILCIIVARIGDTLLVTPTLHALRQTWPEVRLHVVAHPKQMDLLKNNPDITRLRGFTKKSACFKGWTTSLGGLRKPMDLALVYGADPALFRYARRMANRVIGFQSNNDGINALMHDCVAPAPEPMQAVEDRALLLGPLGIPLSQRRLRYRPFEWEPSWITNWLREKAGITEDTLLIGIQANSFPTKAYRNLPPTMVRTILAGLPERYTGARILLLGGAKDRERNQAIAATLGPRALDVSGQFKLRLAAALIGRLDLYIGVDTGPTHIAGCFDLPMVALYHCKHPGRNLMPLDRPRCVIVEHPGTGADCPEERSLADIPMDRIHAAISRVCHPKLDSRASANPL